MLLSQCCRLLEHLVHIGMHHFTVQGVKAGQKAIHHTKPVVKTGSQYDAGTVSIMERREHHGRKRFSLVKFYS